MSFKKIKPTKTNFIAIKKKLGFAERGKNFLEYKREQLIFQIKKVYNEYLQKRDDFFYTYKSVMITLNQAYKEMGKNNLIFIKDISKIRINPQINVFYRKMANFVITKINYEILQKKQLPTYSFETTSHYLDELIINMKEFFDKLIYIAEMEDLILKLTINFQKINRRINALDHLIIPSFKFEIKKVKDMIEEIEREGYVRLKITKNTIYKKKEIDIL